MSATRATLTLALGTALALSSLPAGAQGHRGGGTRHGGGAHRGGGYAVPRGGPGYRPPVGAAGRHHPGSGDHGGYYRGHRGGYYGHGYYSRGHYGTYRPYYGYGYRPYPYYGYYRPYGFSFSFGWPYSGGYWPYAGPAYGPTYSVGAPYADAVPSDGGGAPPPSWERDRVEADRDPGRVSDSDETGRLRLEVKPDDAAVYIDDAFWAEAREARMLWLRAGVHTVEVVRPGLPTERREVRVVKGATVVLRLGRPPS
jgi:hypothetical protein